MISVWVSLILIIKQRRNHLLFFGTVIILDYTDYIRVPNQVVKNDFVSKGRSVSDLKAHLVLTTKYRRKAITGEMLKRLHVILEDLLVKWECKLVEFNGETDHVHLLFQYHPDLQLSTLVGNIKSTTSGRLRREFPEHLSRFYTKDVFWNGSYFIASCGGVTISTLKQYIEAQDSPHIGDSSTTSLPHQPCG